MPYWIIRLAVINVKLLAEHYTYLEEHRNSGFFFCFCFLSTDRYKAVVLFDVCMVCDARLQILAFPTRFSAIFTRTGYVRLIPGVRRYSA